MNSILYTYTTFNFLDLSKIGTMNSDEWMKLDSTTLKNIAKKFGIKETTKSKIVLSLLNKIEEETRINVNDLEEKIEELKNQLEEARRNNRDILLISSQEILAKSII